MERGRGVVTLNHYCSFTLGSNFLSCFFFFLTLPSVLDGLDYADHRYWCALHTLIMPTRTVKIDLSI